MNHKQWLRTECKHDFFLNNLIDKLDKIGESKKDALFILRDPIWLLSGSTGKIKLCDLIVAYDDYTVPIELKGSWEKYEKAIAQVLSGVDFIEGMLFRNARYGVVVVYNTGGYEYDKVPRGELENYR